MVMAQQTPDAENILENCQKLVDELYHFRDHYFEDHDVSKASERDKDVAELLATTLNSLEKDKEFCESKHRSRFLLLKGKAQNVLSDFNESALRDLERAVKLEPKLVEAWNELGECFWKKGDMEAAKNCFVGALNQEKNKVSLRQLSMVLRQIKGNEKERISNIEESVIKAKEAVQLDPSDGISWCILGNAYLTSFFTLYQNPKLLKQAITAYAQAEKFKTALDHPDFHYNRAIVWKYEEEYDKALESFSRASTLDPLWKEPKEKQNNLEDYLLKVHNLLITKGKLKARRIQSLIQSINDSQLGPYAGGSYTSPSGKTMDLELVTLSDLHSGINLNKVILGKVVCNLTGEEPVPFTFCILDKKQVCWSVTLYNIAQGKGVIIGDTVAIPEPFVQEVKVNIKDAEIHYWNIRVDTPLVLVVNGRKLKMDKQALTEIAVSVVST